MSQKPFLIRHLEGEKLGRFPVWMMRQAGRYLSSYRELRKNHSFWEMVSSPELAAKVSLLPLEELSVDAVIFFSDILTLPYGLGLPIEMRESVGPVLTSPLTKLQDFEVFKTFQAEEHTGFVGEALVKIKKQLSAETALLGFAGAPWTVACYLVEGKSNRNFPQIKGWMYQDPQTFFAALDLLSEATVKYLIQQKRSGVDAVQIFDTWLSEMPRTIFNKFYVPLMNRLFSQVRESGLKVIYFAKGSCHLLEDFRQLHCDVLSVDQTVDLLSVEKLTQAQFALQGNLDPVLLLKADSGLVRRETRLLVQEARQLKRPAILNLGHGILPATPLENAKAFIEEARTQWI